MDFTYGNEVLVKLREESILICACLLNIPCAYNGQPAKRQLDPSIIDKIPFHIVPVCPEQLAGLSTPRTPVEIQNGDGFDVLNHNAAVVSKNGENLTEQFIQGAQITLKIAGLTQADKIITQQRSPSCSCNGIYDGSFSHNLVDGYGVCAALLNLNGIRTIDVNAFESMRHLHRE